MVTLWEPEPILATVPKNEADLPEVFVARFRRATKFYGAGDFQKALREIEAALSIWPDCPEAHNNRGAALRRHLGRHEEALAAYERAIELRPDYADAHYNRGVALGNLERYQEALQAFDQAIELRPDFAEAHYNLGVALGNLQRYEEALVAYGRAVALQLPLQLHIAQAYNNRGDALYHLGRYQEALVDFDQALVIRSDYSVARANRALVLKKLLRGLASGGRGAWLGEKPLGAKHPLILKPGAPSVSDAIIEDRR